MNLGTSLHWVSTKMKDKVCLIEGNEKITYAGLWKEIEDLAKAFLKIGIKENDKVCVILPNGKEFIYSFYGLARINAVSVPLNTYLTPYELAKIFRDCGPKAVITTYTLYKKKIVPILNKDISVILTSEPLESVKDNVFELNGILAKNTGSGKLPRFSANNNQIATINYTYRGTGEPLGAVLSHGNYHHGAIGYLRLTKVATSQRVLLITPMSHIFTLISCVIVPLLRGSTVVIMKTFIPSHIFRAIEEHKVDFIIAVPTIYVLLLRNYHKGSFDISSLKYGITGGSYLPEDANREIKREMGIELLQGYGLTETMPITCNPSSKNKPASLGVPGHEVKVRIVDGEIVIGGPTVMKGYYNKDSENGRYLKDGWFYTGDYGYIDEEGYLYFKGLKKEIVKIGGNNVDLNEVKKVLGSFPGAKSVKLETAEDELWGQRLHAEVSVSSKGDVTEKDIRAFCGERMALYKIPKKIIVSVN
ncbi:MAG: AMP-binding protein [Candidatus Omnitrophota bacterium]|jgi:long-chain acyl-CoA synthetase